MDRYELDRLGFYQFEWLIQVLLKAKFGLSVEAWGGQGDHGRDAYSSETVLSSSDKKSYPGPVVFQAKFVSGANAAEAKSHRSLLGACRQESERIANRRSSGHWSAIRSYFLYTNAPVPAKTRAAIIEVLNPILGFPPTVFGSPDVCAELDLYPQIARSFPQILTFQQLLSSLDGVVSDAVNKDILKRTEIVLNKAREVLPVFVPTRAFDHTWEVLEKHHFVVLSGNPEMGKTSISWAVALAQLARGWQVVDCEQPEDFFRLYQGSRPQIFLADDAFGRTEYIGEVGKRWERQLGGLLHQVDKQHFLIWTSRKHILERAVAEMDVGSAVRFPKPAEVLVRANELSRMDKSLMLYRHAVSANLEEAAKSLLKGHVAQIIDDKHFTPLRIYLFCKNSLPKIARALEAGKLEKNNVSRLIAKTIRETTSEMTKTFKALPVESKWLLTTLLDEGNVRSMKDIDERFRQLSPVPASRPLAEMLEELDDSFVRVMRLGSKSSAIRRWDWVHPSYRDLVVEQLSKDPTMAARYLEKGGISAISLAMSRDGGATGERNRPLLNSRESWKLLREACLRAIKEHPTQNAWKVFAILEGAASSSVMPELASLIFAVCTWTKSYWDEQRTVLSSSLVSRFLGLCDKSGRYISSPSLEVSWTAACSAVVQEGLDAKEDPGSCSVEALEGWMSFIELVNASEPRLIAKDSITSRFDSTISFYVDAMEDRRQMKFNENDPDEYEAEVSQLTSFSALVRSLGSHFPSRDEELNKLADNLENRAEALGEEAEELKREMGYEEPEYDYEGSSSGYRESHFDIIRLFADL